MTRDAVARRAAELAADLPLSTEDWEAVIDQAVRMLAVVATLDELPLDGVEPAGPPLPPAAPHE